MPTGVVIQKAKPDFAKFKSEYNGKQVGDYTVRSRSYEPDKDPGAKEFSEKHNVKGLPHILLLKTGKTIQKII